ncbi:hypothetical protein [Prochlorococcus sp. MIT 1341]|nr:hypothetical protein [Prochlorococcus sp. MIT 1341]
MGFVGLMLMAFSMRLEASVSFQKRMGWVILPFQVVLPSCGLLQLF